MLDISTPICFSKNSAHRFENLIFINKVQEIFLKKNFFSVTWNFFTTENLLIWGSFFEQKNNFTLFFQV